MHYFLYHISSYGMFAWQVLKSFNHFLVGFPFISQIPSKRIINNLLSGNLVQSTDPGIASRQSFL